MHAYSTSGSYIIVVDFDELTELEEELLCCKDNGPYMDELYSVIAGANA